MFPIFFFHFFRMCMKQFLCPCLDAGEICLIRIGKLAFEPRGSYRMTVIRFAFIRFRQELLQQPQIAGVMELHKLCPVFQLCGGDSRELFHIYGMLRFMLQKGNEKPLAFKIIRLLNAVDRAIGRSPAACPEPAEGQIIHPAAEDKALENVDGIFRRSARQLYAVNGRYGILPDIGAVKSLGFPEKRMIAMLFKHGTQPLRKPVFVCIRQALSLSHNIGIPRLSQN